MNKRAWFWLALAVGGFFIYRWAQDARARRIMSLPTGYEGYLPAPGKTGGAYTSDQQVIRDREGTVVKGGTLIRGSDRDLIR